MKFVIKNAQIEGYEGLQDINVSGEKISDIVSSKDNKDIDQPAVDAQGCWVYPPFVNCHFHLDKVLMTHSATEDSKYIGGKEVGGSSVAKENLTAADVIERGERMIGMALGTGTTYIRSNVDIDPIVEFRALEGVMALKERYADKIYIELVAFPQEGFLVDKRVKGMMEEALKMGVEVVGGKPASDPQDKKKHMDILIELAEKYDRDIDVHLDTDYYLDYNSNTSKHKDGKEYPDDLEVVYLAEKVIEHGLQGRAVASNLVAIDCLTHDLRNNVTDLLREAQISVAVCPLVCLYEMGRDDPYNVRRGIAPVKALLKAGVVTAYATDNVGDAFSIFSNADMLMHGLITANACQFKTAKDIKTVMEMGTINPAKIMKLKDYGLKAGGEASFVVYDGTDFYDIFANNRVRKQVYYKGKLVAVNWTGRMVVP